MADRIFISYSHSDSAFVRWLREELRNRGYDVWFDSNAIQIGQIWREEIVQGIEESDYFMVIISSRSIQSANVVKELSLAESFGKIILPIMIEDVSIPAKMKYQLAGVQFIVLDSNRSAENLDLLVEGLRNQAIASGRDFIASRLLSRGYELENLMGQSDQSTTYRVKDQKRGRDAVLKIYPASATMVPKFQAEAKKLEALRHQGFPLILDHFEERSCYCLVQEFITGTPWNAVQWTGEMITFHARKILALLSVMHDQGIVHADIRPDNLLLLPATNDSYVVDLSLIHTALLMRQASPQSSITERYNQHLPTRSRGFARGFFQAPEFIRFSVLTPAIDLYGLGVSLLVLCSGRNPDTLYQKNVGQWLMSDLDDSVRRWLAPMLIDSPSERVHDAKQVLALMESHSCMIPQSPTPEPAWSASASDPLLSALPSALPGDDQSASSPSSLDQQSPSLLANPPSSPIPTEPRNLASGEQRWSRNRLLACLLLQIGPVAESLLQQWPGDLNAINKEALRRSFADIGIDSLILDECMDQASFSAEDQASKPPMVVQITPQASLAKSSSLLEWLRYEVGPIADVLWETSLEEDLQNNPDQARLNLERMGMKIDVINQLFQRISTGVPPAPEVPQQRSTNSQTQESQSPAQSNPDVEIHQAASSVTLPESNQPLQIPEAQLESILLDLLGPMAHPLVEEVASVAPVEERVKRLMTRLNQLGVSAEIVETLKSRLKPWSLD
ncbi:MAG: TIR domain-containing protein [Cyanobacteriota bacterium]|jgi:serine/threonine protein kinase